MNGNWSQLDMTTELGASTTVASLALTTFWAMVTLGRVLFASIQRWFPTHRTYHLLPIVLVAVFVVIASLPTAARRRRASPSASPASAARRCCR